MSAESESLRSLLERRALYDLVLRYAQSVDRREYAAVGTLFLPDGQIEGYHGEVAEKELLYRLEGRDGIVAGLRGLDQFEKTFHLVANQLAELDGDAATGETYCMAHHIHRQSGELWNRTMAIRYQERFVRGDGHWFFQRRQLVIDWERDGPVAQERPT